MPELRPAARCGRSWGWRSHCADRHARAMARPASVVRAVQRHVELDEVRVDRRADAHAIGRAVDRAGDMEGDRAALAAGSLSPGTWPVAIFPAPSARRRCAPSMIRSSSPLSSGR